MFLTNKKVSTGLFIALFLLAFFGLAKTVKAESELIKNFGVGITIQEDGSIDVIENIVYDFKKNPGHGIFRKIPLKPADGPTLIVEVLNVTDEEGNPYSYVTSLSNNILTIKIGDPNKLITGPNNYVISYKAYNAIREFEDHDELYWNATGNDWPVEILSGSVKVILPDPMIPDVMTRCFTGLYGENNKSCTFSHNNSAVEYKTTKPLDVGEGLTIVVGFPPTYVQNVYVEPENSNSNKFFILVAFLPLIILIMIIILSLIYKNRKKNPRPVIPRRLRGEPIIVSYDPPSNLSPIEVGTILDRQVDTTDVSSIIIDLAVRGFIKIKYITKKIRFLPDKNDFEIVKTKNNNRPLNSVDKIIFDLLFSNRESVKLSDLEDERTSFHSNIEEIKDDVEEKLKNNGYFKKEIDKKYKKIKIALSILIITFFVGFLISLLFMSKIGFLIVFIITALVIFFSVLLAKQTNKLTSLGMSTLKKILGFREFLQLTEKDKLELLNAPKLEPEIFEKFLAYAMVLGVEDKWANKFENVYQKTPSWYEDSTSSRFNSHDLVKNMIVFNNSFNHVFNISSPRSGSSSGFSSGGFSGGGSGGGGGGSW